MTILHHIGDWIREILLQVPLGVARGLFLALIAGLLIWVLCLPRSHVRPAKDKIHPTENLKIWAALSLFVQLLVYSFF